jgi:hypothetical protein
MIHCIGRPNIELDAFAAAGKQVLGRSLTDPLSKSRRQYSVVAKFLAVLALFHNPTAPEPLEALRTSQSLLSHLHYTYLVKCSYDTIVKAMERTDLRITLSDGDLYVVSGTVSELRHACLECCVESAPKELRYLFDCIITHLESEGLTPVFSDIKKQPGKDGTFLLCLKT